MTSTLQRYIAVFTLFAAALLLNSCSDYTQRVEATRQEVDRLAVKIDKAFRTIRENTVVRKDIIEKAYKNKSQYDLSIEGMDVSAGGAYEWFGDYLYYAVKDTFQGKGMLNYLNSETGLYIDPEYDYAPENADKARKLAKDAPEIVEIKKIIRLWEHILVDVVEAGEDPGPGYTEFVYGCNPRLWLNMFSMYFDYASVISSKLTQDTFMSTGWVMNGTPYGNPEEVPKWTQDAFAGMAGEGWIQSVSIPMYVDGEYIGFINSNLYPVEIAEKEFKEHEQHLMFLGSAAYLLGVSKSAKPLLEVKEIHDYDYLEQMKDNAFFENEFKLTHETQQPYTQEIGQKVLAGEKEFDVKIKGKNYSVLVAEIPEVGFYVVGLVEK